MLPLRAAVVAFTFGLVAGCFQERVPPPTYRFACEGNGDCIDGERCIDSLCQKPCTQRTFAEDCGEDNGFAMCFNGVCTSTCDVAREGACPSPQECLDLGIELGGGGGFFSQGGGDAVIGICMKACTNTSCPTGEVCFGGACLSTCDEAGDEPCPSGVVPLSCIGGVCLPSVGDEGGPPLDDGGSEASSDDGGSGTTAAEETSG